MCKIRICIGCDLDSCLVYFNHCKKICKNCEEFLIKNFLNICYTCLFVGELTLFKNNKNECKKCSTIRGKKYEKDNKDKRKKQKAKYYLENIDEMKRKQKENYYKDIEKTRIKNRDGHKKYRSTPENIEKERTYRRQYKNNKLQTDPAYKLRHMISGAIRDTLKTAGLSKNKQSSTKYLPYSIQDLVKYIQNQFEPWMTWKNNGIYNAKTWDDNDPTTWTWQLDHITPQSDLPYTSMEDENFKKCWALENLRPYSAKQNSIDGINRTRHISKIDNRLNEEEGIQKE
jgi:hypothetical protein